MNKRGVGGKMVPKEMQFFSDWSFCENIELWGGGGVGNGSIVMGVHWNTQNTSKYITICIVMYFAYSNGIPSQYCHH